MTMRIKLLLCLLLGLFASKQLWSQSMVCVLDKHSGLPIEKVSILANGKTTLTDKDGFFNIDALQVQDSDTIKLSSVGYATVLIIKRDIKDNLIQMQPRAEDIDEVSVTGKQELKFLLEYKMMSPMKKAVLHLV